MQDTVRGLTKMQGMPAYRRLAGRQMPQPMLEGLVCVALGVGDQHLQPFAQQALGKLLQVAAKRPGRRLDQQPA